MHRPPRSLSSSLAALGGAALLCAPKTAHAEGSVSVSPGLSLSVSFGNKVAVGLTADLRVTDLIVGQSSTCSSDSRLGMGGFVQATWLMNVSAARFAAGVHGGGEAYQQLVAADGELGWTYRTGLGAGYPGQHGIHLGALGLFMPKEFPSTATPWLELPVRVVIPLGGLVREPEVIPGLGFRVPSMFGAPRQLCISGRPMRGEEGSLLPAVVAAGERRTRHLGLDRGTRAALAEAWIDDLRAECGSIPTFVALAWDLAATGAPARLVARALEAAGDELRHTLLCRELASDLAGLDLAPLLLAPPPAPVVDRRDALLRLALEAWFDGCLGEGAAADRAARGAAAADERAPRTALEAIARDEGRHAVLGWSVLGHCLATGGSEVADALAEARSAPPAEPPRGDAERDADPRALRAHGRLTQREVDASWHHTQASARRRASALLSSAAG